MAYQTVLSGNVTLQQPGVVEVMVDARQIFSGYPSNWGFQVYIDGALAYDTGGCTMPGDVVHLSGRRACGAGTRTAYVNWAGNSNIQLSACTMSIKGYDNNQFQ